VRSRGPVAAAWRAGARRCNSIFYGPALLARLRGSGRRARRGAACVDHVVPARHAPLATRSDSPRSQDPRQLEVRGRLRLVPSVSERPPRTLGPDRRGASRFCSAHARRAPCSREPPPREAALPARWPDGRSCVLADLRLTLRLRAQDVESAVLFPRATRTLSLLVWHMVYDPAEARQSLRAMQTEA
jgi:hypothetical protein